MSLVIEISGNWDAPQEYIDTLNENISRNLGDLGVLGKRLAVSNTPVDTGSMADAWEAMAGPRRAVIRVSPYARNSRSGVRVIEYAAVVNERRGITGQVVRGVRDSAKGMEWLKKS